MRTRLYNLRQVSLAYQQETGVRDHTIICETSVPGSLEPQMSAAARTAFFFILPLLSGRGRQFFCNLPIFVVQKGPRDVYACYGGIMHHKRR